MTVTLDRPTADIRSGDGGVPARRAVVRWAWRLFFREWRQQLLVLALIIVAVTVTVVGAGVAINTPTLNNVGFGNANAQVQLPAGDPTLTATVSALRRQVGAVDVIDNVTVAIPGSIATYQLRAQNSHGPYDKAMVSVISGHTPDTDGEVAVTPSVASAFGLHVGSVWHDDGVIRHVVGIVQDPLNLLDEFALVLPGQAGPSGQVTLLFDATPAQGRALGQTLGQNIQRPPTTLNGFNPKIFVILIATLGMLLIGLVAVGGFTVLAQRRMRAIGMLGALGATDKNIRLVVRANGLAVGVVGTVVGAVLGLAAWLGYRPHVEQASHHLIGAFALPWVVIVPAMALAIVTTWLAATRPARAIAGVPVVTALAGRPAPPRQLHRSAIPGVAVTAGAYVLILYAGASKGNGGGAPELVLGFVLLTIGMVLLAPTAISVVARLSRRLPLAIRMALRDLNRYRARSGSALGAISLGVLMASTVCVLAAARYGNVLDYAGPNVTNSQLIVYTPTGNPNYGGAPSPHQPSSAVMRAQAGAIESALGSHKLIELDSPDVQLTHQGSGRNFTGQLYVATPQLLKAFGIDARSIDAKAEILTMRPGLPSVSNLVMAVSQPLGSGTVTKVSPGSSSGPGPGPGPGGDSSQGPCAPPQCVATPLMQSVGALPSGTSAPNTVVTEHAMRTLHLQSSVAGWMIFTNHPLTTTQITNARRSASTLGMIVETKSDLPSSAQVINWATVVGILLALGLLAMTVGLIRSETAGDLRTLTATGAGTGTRRALTAVTAGALALIGAVMGTVGAYLAALAFLSGSPNGDSISELSSVPLFNLGLILIGMPLLGAACAWLFAGRQPPYIAAKPME